MRSQTRKGEVGNFGANAHLSNDRTLLVRLKSASYNNVVPGERQKQKRPHGGYVASAAAATTTAALRRRRRGRRALRGGGDVQRLRRPCRRKDPGQAPQKEGVQEGAQRTEEGQERIRSVFNGRQGGGQGVSSCWIKVSFFNFQFSIFLSITYIILISINIISLARRSCLVYMPGARARLAGAHNSTILLDSVQPTAHETGNRNDDGFVLGFLGRIEGGSGRSESDLEADEVSRWFFGESCTLHARYITSHHDLVYLRIDQPSVASFFFCLQASAFYVPLRSKHTYHRALTLLLHQ